MTEISYVWPLTPRHISDGKKNTPYKNLNHDNGAFNITNIKQKNVEHSITKFYILISKESDFISNELFDFINPYPDIDIYIIGQDSSFEDNTTNVNNANIDNYIKNKLSPFENDNLVSTIGQFKMNIDNNDNDIRSEFTAAKERTAFQKEITVSGNIHFMNLTFFDKVKINLNNMNGGNIIFSNCYFQGTGIEIQQDTVLNKAVIYNCAFNECANLNISNPNLWGAINLYNVQNVNIYNCYINGSTNGIIGNSIKPSGISGNNEGLKIKNCKIYYSTYNGLVINFILDNMALNKIINVDCSYSSLGNGFKIKGAILENCKSRWNRFAGFICIDCKYLLNCYSLNNETGIMVSRSNYFTRDKDFTFDSILDLNRDFSDTGIQKKININFFNCSIKGNLRGGGISFNITNSYSIIANCEISGNQGEIITLYNPSKYKNDYYFAGGGIKGFKDNSLFIIHSTIFGNLGYGIFIMDDIKWVKSNYNLNETLDNKDIDSVGELSEISSEDKDFKLSKDFQIHKCEKTTSCTDCSTCSNLPNKYTVTSNWKDNTQQITNCNSSQICNSGVDNGGNPKSNISYIGHLYLVNSIIMGNSGGQIMRYLNFSSNTYRYSTFNTVIGNYKDDIEFSVPLNICSWNPYKNIYYTKEIDTLDNNINRIYPLHNIVKTYNSIESSNGFSVFYKKKIFKAFELPANITNARDDIDVRLNLFDNDTYDSITDSVGNTPLKGIKLFNDNKFNFSISIVDLLGVDNNDTFEDLFLNNNTYFPQLICDKEADCPHLKCINVMKNDRCYDMDSNYKLGEYDILDKTNIKESERLFQNKNTGEAINYFKEFLKKDFDGNPRPTLLSSTEYPYVGCFEKPSNVYCNYYWNSVGSDFNKNTKKFNTNINCCEGGRCSSVVNSSALLNKGLILNLNRQTETDNIMKKKCMKFQSQLNTKATIELNDDLEEEESDIKCTLPNLSMYDYKGTHYENKFRCGKDCKVSWYTSQPVKIETESDVSFGLDQKNIYFKIGKIKKLEPGWENSDKFKLKNGNRLKEEEVMSLYPNECMASAEHEYSEDDYCFNDSDNVSNWLKDDDKKKYLPLIPHGCPSFGGKKCPKNLFKISNNPDLETESDNIFDINNTIDTIFDTQDIKNATVEIDKVIKNSLSDTSKLQESDDYIKLTCEDGGYLTSNPSEQVKFYMKNYTANNGGNNNLLIIVIVIIIIILISAVILFI